MWTGKRFKIKKSTIVIDHSGSQAIATQIPGGAIVEILSGPESESPASMIRVRWEGYTFSMFAADLAERGEIVNTAELAR